MRSEEKVPVVWAKKNSQGYQLHAVPSLSVQDANDFLEALSIRGLSLATLRAYAFDLVSFYRWLHASHRKLTELHPMHLLDFIQSQRRDGAHPKSINRRLTTCEQLYRFVTGTPIQHAPIAPAPHYAGRGREHALGLHSRKRASQRKLRVKTPHKLIEPLTVHQVAALLRRLRRSRDRAIVYLMLLCGLRSLEVLSIRLIDVLWDEQRLRVRGKGNRERVLPLPDIIRKILYDYLHLERPKNARTELFFVILQGARRSQPMTLEGLRSLFRCRRASTPELAHANAHRLRHTFGTDMARAGVRLPILQRMMGHADGKTTLQYIHLSMADLAQEYARAIETIQKRYEHKP